MTFLQNWQIVFTGRKRLSTFALDVKTIKFDPRRRAAMVSRFIFPLNNNFLLDKISRLHFLNRINLFTL